MGICCQENKNKTKFIEKDFKGKEKNKNFKNKKDKTKNINLKNLKDEKGNNNFPNKNILKEKKENNVIPNISKNKNEVDNFPKQNILKDRKEGSIILRASENSNKNNDFIEFNDLKNEKQNSNNNNNIKTKIVLKNENESFLKTSENNNENNNFQELNDSKDIKGSNNIQENYILKGEKENGNISRTSENNSHNNNFSGFIILKKEKENNNLSDQNILKDEKENDNISRTSENKNENIFTDKNEKDNILQNSENNNLPELNIINKEKEKNNFQIKNILKYEKENNSILNNQEIKNENINIINQNIIINEKENINLQIPEIENENNYHQNSNENNIIIENSECNNENDEFPKGTKYEEELSSNFTYFNVYWYDPNNANDFELFEKCFKNVQFYKGKKINSLINFFKTESISEWIVVTPGSKGKDLIEKLEKFDCIKAFFIYCYDVKLNESWAKNIKKVSCITSSPEILCQKFIEINENYIIPKFNYKGKSIEDINLNLNEENPEEISNINSSFLKDTIRCTNLKKNKYNNLCIKLFNYLNSDEVEKDLKETIEAGNSALNLILNHLQGMGSIGNINLADFDLKHTLIESNIKNTKNLIFLSLYFSKCLYLLNYLSFHEVIEIFKTTENIDVNAQAKLFLNSESLCDKIKENKCIIEEKESIREIQISIIQLLASILKSANVDINNIIKYYQIINFFRDVDFCLKLMILNIISNFNSKNHNFISETNLCLVACEYRYFIYSLYSKQIELENKFTEKEQKKIYETLTIKDFIIIGDENFHNKIKNIEKNIKANSLNYINMEKLPKFLDDKRPKKGKKLSTFFYFLIIRLEEFHKNFENIFTMYLKYGLTFLVFLYAENDKIVPYKNTFNFIFQTIFVYFPEDILYYLSQKLKIEHP